MIKIIIILKKFLSINNNLNIPYFTLKKFDEDVTSIFKKIINDTDSMGTSLIMKILLDIFRNNNLIINKFLLNFTIFICVIEEYMKNNNLINKTINKNITMFDIINDGNIDVITFCEVNKCYTEICDLIKLKSKNNFKIYKNNNQINNQIDNNNQKDNNNQIDNNNQKNNNNQIDNNTKKLFCSIELSNLTFKSPE